MMFSWTFTFWLLQTLVPLSSSDGFQCMTKAKHPLHSDGNVMIAALIPIFNYYRKTTLDFTGEDQTDLQ